MQRVLCGRVPSVTKFVKSWNRGLSSSSSIKVEAEHEEQLNADTEQNQCSRVFQQLSHPTVDKIIRVNQAGERAAVMIYAGQTAVLGKSELGDCIQHMEEQEKVHVESFEDLVIRRRVRPSLFLPLWEFAGFALGASTALLGKEAAMACTVAVEDTIEHHYNSQLRELLANHQEEEELLKLISKCRDEEVEHKELGLHHNAEQAPGHEALTQVINIGCKLAISVAERI